MPLNNPDVSPYYVCLDCRQRVSEEVDDRLCSACGGYLKDLTVSKTE